MNNIDIIIIQNHNKVDIRHPHSIADHMFIEVQTRRLSQTQDQGEGEFKTMNKFATQRRKSNAKGMKFVKHNFGKRHFSTYSCYETLPNLPKIQEQKSLFEESNLYVNTFHLLKGLETVSFATDEEQRTFWFTLPSKEKIKEMHRFEAEYDLKNRGFVQANQPQYQEKLGMQEEQPIETEECESQDIQVEQRIYEIEQERLKLKYAIFKMEQPMVKLQPVSRARCKRTAVKKKMPALPRERLFDDFSKDHPPVVDSNGTWIPSYKIECPKVKAVDASSNKNPSFNPLTGTEINEIQWLNRKSSSCTGDSHSRQEQVGKLRAYFASINDFLQKKTTESLGVKERKELWRMWYSSRFGYDEKQMEDITVFLSKYEAAEPSKQFIYAAEYEMIKERKENIAFFQNYRVSVIDPQQI